MRKLLTTLFLVVLATVAWAQNAVAVWQQDGKVAKFGFAEKPVVTYADNNLVITTTQTTVEYPIYLLRKISFDVDWTVDAVEEVKAEPLKPSLHLAPGEIAIQGAEPGSVVQVYSVKGLLVQSARVGADGSVTLSTTGLPASIYIVKTTKSTFKIVKK